MPCNHSTLTIGLCLWSAIWSATVQAADKPELVNRSPFGVVCYWPGIDQAALKWCRVGAGATSLANWPDIQPSEKTWDWTRSDSELRTLRDQHGVSVLPILGYTPKWASRKPDESKANQYPPKDLATYHRFVYECVARYKDHIKVWEVWNEPNIAFLNGNAADYANMVKTACVAAKQADPECRVAMGCAGVDTDFLQRLYEFGAGAYFDVMSVHPYQWGKEFNDDWMRTKLEACRALMDHHGDAGKEIWITEIGWSMAEGVNAEEQADLLVQGLVTALSLRERLKLEKLFWFCVKDWGGPGFGILDVDGKPKPAFLAYQSLTTELPSAQYRGAWKTPTGVSAHVFEQDGKPVVVLWHRSLAGKTPIELATHAQNLTIRNARNQIQSLPVQQGKATIEATHQPVFIRGLSMSDLKPLTTSAPPAASPAHSARPCNVWASAVTPTTTTRPFASLGAKAQLPLEIHNESDQPAQGKLQLELVCKDQTLAKDEIAFDAAAGKVQAIDWQPTVAMRPELAGELAMLRLRGNAGSSALAPFDLPIRLARGKTIEFSANGWTEGQYTYKADKSCTAESVRFGNEFGYRFTLGNAQSGQLRINVGANAANAWSLLISSDDKEYKEERSGKSWPGWQTVSLDPYLAKPHEDPATIYVKIQGNDCQVREVIVESDR